jgi:hypothetical protein
MIIPSAALGISTDSLGKIIQQLVVITGIISWVVSSIAFYGWDVLNTTTDVVSTTAKQ